MGRKNKGCNIIMWVSQLVSATADLPQYFRASVGKLGILGLLRIFAVSLIIGNTNFESHLSLVFIPNKRASQVPASAGNARAEGSISRSGDPLEQGMAHSSILAQKIPWAEEPDGYSPWGCKELDMTEHACKRTSQIKKNCSFLYQIYITKKNTYCYSNLNFIIKILFFLFIYKCLYNILNFAPWSTNPKIFFIWPSMEKVCQPLLQNICSFPSCHPFGRKAERMSRKPQICFHSLISDHKQKLILMNN